MTTTEPERPASSRARVVGGWWAPAMGVSVFGLVTAIALDRTGATREIFFNVQQPWAVYVMFSVLVGLLAYGFGRHATLWAIGKPTPGLRERVATRLTHVVRLGLAQEKVR